MRWIFLKSHTVPIQYGFGGTLALNKNLSTVGIVSILFNTHPSIVVGPGSRRPRGRRVYEKFEPLVGRVVSKPNYRNNPRRKRKIDFCFPTIPLIRYYYYYHS